MNVHNYAKFLLNAEKGASSKNQGAILSKDVPKSIISTLDFLSVESARVSKKETKETSDFESNSHMSL